MELSATYKQLNFVPVIGDILDVNLLREVFAQHRPQSVLLPRLTARSDDGTALLSGSHKQRLWNLQCCAGRTPVPGR